MICCCFVKKYSFMLLSPISFWRYMLFLFVFLLSYLIFLDFLCRRVYFLQVWLHLPIKPIHYLPMKYIYFIWCRESALGTDSSSHPSDTCPICHFSYPYLFNFKIWTNWYSYERIKNLTYLNISILLFFRNWCIALSLYIHVLYPCMCLCFLAIYTLSRKYEIWNISCSLVVLTLAFVLCIRT